MNGLLTGISSLEVGNIQRNALNPKPKAREQATTWSNLRKTQSDRNPEKKVSPSAPKIPAEKRNSANLRCLHFIFRVKKPPEAGNQTPQNLPSGKVHKNTGKDVIFPKIPGGFAAAL